MEWVGQKKAYLETQEPVASVADAQQNLATWTSYEEEKSIAITGMPTHKPPSRRSHVHLHLP